MFYADDTVYGKLKTRMAKPIWAHWESQSPLFVSSVRKGACDGARS